LLSAIRFWNQKYGDPVLGFYNRLAHYQARASIWTFDELFWWHIRLL